MSWRTAGEWVSGSTRLNLWTGEDDEEDAGEAMASVNKHWGYEWRLHGWRGYLKRIGWAKQPTGESRSRSDSLWQPNQFAPLSPAASLSATLPLTRFLSSRQLRILQRWLNCAICRIAYAVALLSRNCENCALAPIWQLYCPPDNYLLVIVQALSIILIRTASPSLISSRTATIDLSTDPLPI